MKIVLRAFNNKLEGVREVPEGTDRRFKLAMSQPIQIGNFEGGKFDLMKEPIATICTFEWTGGVFSQDGHDWDGAKEYQLVDIEKR